MQILKPSQECGLAWILLPHDTVVLSSKSVAIVTIDLQLFPFLSRGSSLRSDPFPARNIC